MIPKHARQLVNLRQVDMAKKLKIHLVTYSRLENEPGRYTIYQARLFCEIVGRTLEEIFGESSGTL